MSKFRAITEDLIEETTETVIVHKISEVKQKLAACAGSVASYEKQIAELGVLLKDLEAEAAKKAPAE